MLEITQRRTFGERYLLVVLAICPLVGCFTEGRSRSHAVVVTQPSVIACDRSIDSLMSVDALSDPEGPGTYQAPSAERRAAIHRTLVALSERRWSEAADGAEHADYNLCRAGDVAVLTPSASDSHQARIAVRIGDAKPVAYEAPHPFHDRGTVAQARELFQRTSGRALIISGTHRCENAGVPSGHPGHTRACGERSPYAESDMAHATATVFHQAHVSLFEVYRDATFVSLHGMAQRGVSISNGTKLPLPAATQPAATQPAATRPVARLMRELERTLPDERITTCNAHEGAAPRYRLCGTTNVQGRHANGYARASVVEPLRSSGRFVHLEQSRRVRRARAAVTSAFVRWLDG